LQQSFDTLINSFVLNKVGIAENFLPQPLAASLTLNIEKLFAQSAMHAAGIGNNKLQNYDSAIRADVIYWLDRSHNNVAENNFLDLIDAFVLYLNATCYTGITGYEFHYAMYSGGGFYKRHFDRFKSDGSRAFSLIMYLNTNWQLADGGELCIHQGTVAQNISPQSGKGVFFRSNELEHEVLLTHKTRMSITGWLKIAAPNG
jgi:SM-20-related protein